jgi:hypothetical protein
MEFKTIRCEDDLNYYRQLCKANGEKIIIQIPQYFTNPIISRTSPTKRFLIRLDSVMDELIPIYKYVAKKHISVHRMGMHARLYTKTSDNRCIYYDIEGRVLDQRSLYNKKGAVRYEIHVKGFSVTEGIAILNIVPVRCVFFECEEKDEIELEFPKEKVLSLPPHMLNLFNKLPKEDKMCPICMEEISEALTMTSCYHFFHVACLSKTKENTCPTCRASLEKRE